MHQLQYRRILAALTLGLTVISSLPAAAYDDYRYQDNPDDYGRYERRPPPQDDYGQQQQPREPYRSAPPSSLPFGMSKSAAGAVAGALLGAGSGAIIGSHRGKAGEGAAIGAGVGAVGGYLMGRQVENQDVALDSQDQLLEQQRQEIARNRDLINELKRQKLDARETRRGVVVNLPDVLFEYNQARLTGDARSKVAFIADVLERRAANRRVSVEGHADSIGSQEYNLDLSQRRAESVTRELAYSGVGEGRLNTRGFGEKYPVAPNANSDGSDNPAGRAKNRRVEVVIEN